MCVWVYVCEGGIPVNVVFNTPTITPTTTTTTTSIKLLKWALI